MIKNTFESLPVGEFDFIGVSRRVVMHFDYFGVEMMDDLSHEYSIGKISADISYLFDRVTFWVYWGVNHRPNHKVSQVGIILTEGLLTLLLLLLTYFLKFIKLSHYKLTSFIIYYLYQIKSKTLSNYPFIINIKSSLFQYKSLIKKNR